MDFELPATFYLGAALDPATGERSTQPLLYDARDLTTHAVCVGMTGSGKTGLCLSLLEEAAIDGVPCIAIDPKGDLSNLLLSFPDLAPSDFEPWVDADEARRHGVSVSERAVQVAEQWKRGLADWGQDGARIQRFREGAEVALYTPGLASGRPLQVLQTLSCPDDDVLDDADALRARIEGVVGGLLALLGVEGDPLRSREHILLSNILHRCWTQGEDLDLGGLIRAITEPGFDRIGVMDLESVFPAKDRQGLAMTLNNLLAAPGFEAWLEGEALDIERLLYREDGRPRLTVLSIAHLSDAERMFFVTVLLNQVVAWMRTRSGTSSLRAVLYMDEVAGYFPPSAAPPSKAPMLTLLKQGRASGLGVVLATQNPADLDYKGLSNAGTWFIGRLQTDRDKSKVLEGLKGADGASDSGSLDQLISGLGKRVFLMHNVHENQPVRFHTRWALSWLRGPLGRRQIRDLCKQTVGAPAPTVGVVPEAVEPEAASPAAREIVRPVVPSDIREHFGEGSGAYHPMLMATARLHFVHTASGVDRWVEQTWLAELPEEGPADWEAAEQLEDWPRCSTTPESDVAFGELPAGGSRARSYASWSKQLKETLYRTQTSMTWRYPRLKLRSDNDEDRGLFAARVQLAIRERRDKELDKLKERYKKKMETLDGRILRARQKIEREQDQLRNQQWSTAASVGASVLGALLGRKLVSVTTANKGATAMRSASRVLQEKGDIERARESLADLERQYRELDAEFAAALDEKGSEWEPAVVELEEVPLKPRKADLAVERVDLYWAR